MSHELSSELSPQRPQAEADGAPPVAHAAAPGRAGHLPRLGMVELLDREGAVSHRVAVTQWPVTLGRGLDCDVVLDDPCAAPLHATLVATGGQVALHVGATRNGVRIGRAVLAAGAQAPLAAGAEWQIGRTRLRLRLAGELLPEEAPLALPAPTRAPWILAGVALLLAWVLGERWLQSDPGEPLGGYLPALVGVPVALAVWCFVWALGSKLFAKHFDYLAHLRVALGTLLVSLLLEAVMPLAAFALSWEWLPRAAELLGLALGSVLIYGHLSLILPTRRRALAVGFLSLFVVGAGLKLGLNQQREDRWFTPLYMSTLGPPWLRVAPAVPPQRFIDEAQAMKAPLEARARRLDDGPLLPQDDDD